MIRQEGASEKCEQSRGATAYQIFEKDTRGKGKGSRNWTSHKFWETEKGKRLVNQGDLRRIRANKENSRERTNKKRREKVFTWEKAGGGLVN